MLATVPRFLGEQIYSPFLAVDFDFSAVELPFTSNLTRNYVKRSTVVRPVQRNGKIGIARGARDIDGAINEPASLDRLAQFLNNFLVVACQIHALGTGPGRLHSAQDDANDSRTQQDRENKAPQTTDRQEPFPIPSPPTSLLYLFHDFGSQYVSKWLRFSKPRKVRREGRQGRPRLRGLCEPFHCA